MITTKRKQNPIVNDISINKLIDIDPPKKLGFSIYPFNAVNKCEPRNVSIDITIMFI